MRCINCGREIPDGSKFCTFCGTRQTGPSTAAQVQPNQSFYGNAAYPQQGYMQPSGVVTQPVSTENVGMGVLGALLLSLVGILIYIGIYQLGYIIFASGIIMFNFCLFGYNKFSKADANQNYSKKGIVICGIITLVGMIFAEYIALGIEIFKAYKDYGTTLFESLAAVPSFLTDGEVLGAALQDIAISFIVFIIFFFMSLFGGKERKRKARTRTNQQYHVQQNYQNIQVPQQNYQGQSAQPQQQTYVQAGQSGYYQPPVNQPVQGNQGYYGNAPQYPQQNQGSYPGQQNGNGGQNQSN